MSTLNCSTGENHCCVSGNNFDIEMTLKEGITSFDYRLHLAGTIINSVIESFLHTINTLPDEENLPVGIGISSDLWKDDLMQTEIFLYYADKFVERLKKKLEIRSTLRL